MKKNDKKRALRRHHERRLKERVKREGYFNRYWEDKKPVKKDGELVLKERSEDEKKAIIAKIADHPAMCSCWMCGNPRRHHNQETYQEHKAEIDAVQQIEELGIPENKINL